jgi:uroporphyrin-III C-methyltransferase/precorrin-2 dehydrogenase/sirohydrochlorin ferrochelatase
MPRLYPLFADLEGRRVLVVGGGVVTERKARALADTGAHVHVIALEIAPGLRALADSGHVLWRRERFAPIALRGASLVIAASANATLNREVAAAARAERIFVNVVDDAELSTFHVPAIVNRAPVQVAVSSGGTAPALAAAIRGHLESLLDESLGPLATLLARWRARIKVAFPDVSVRRRFYRRVLESNIPSVLRNGQVFQAERRLARALSRTASEEGFRGRVALVGAGSGDPGLLTLRGLRLLQAADVILHDRLVSPDVLALARRDARVVAVGKAAGKRGWTQARINALMAEQAAAGRLVVRLKGGDPFVFGRGGEELEYLRARDIPYEVVPGVTSALACAAYAGVPLTHRAHAHGMHWISAQSAAAVAALDGASLARPEQTLVAYMGLAQLERLTGKLLAHGRIAATPFALIENGTRPEQRVVTGTLERLPELARLHSVRAPALLIVGEVAAFASRLAWFGGEQVSPASLRAVA